MNDLITLLKQSEQIELQQEWLEFTESLQWADEEKPRIDWD